MSLWESSEGEHSTLKFQQPFRVAFLLNRRLIIDICHITEQKLEKSEQFYNRTVNDIDKL